MVTNSNLSTAWPLFLSLLAVQGFPLCRICPVDEHIALTWWCTSHNTLAMAQNTYSQSSKARESSQSRCPFLSLWNTNSLPTVVSHTDVTWLSHDSATLNLTRFMIHIHTFLPVGPISPSFPGRPWIPFCPGAPCKPIKPLGPWSPCTHKSSHYVTV